MRHARRLRGARARAAAAALAVATAATAGQVAKDAFHEEGTFVVEDFCAVDGMDVEVSFALDVRVHIVPHGRDRLDYFLQHGERTEVLTNLANGTSISSLTRVIEKDMRVTDNGDGTLTILIQATGNAVLYGSDGKAIARNPGLVRLVILVDHGGTPTDPSDDEFVADLGIVKGSTGRSDDFCSAAVAALG